MSVEDLEDFIRIGAPRFESVPQLAALEDIGLTLKAKGTLAGFSVTTRINTSPGTLLFDGRGRADGRFENISVDGRLRSDNLRIGKVIGEQVGVDDLSLNTVANVKIRKKERPVVAIDGNIGSVSYKGYPYRDIAVNGTYNGNENSVAGRVLMDTEENRFDLQADIGFGDRMKFDVNGIIDKLFLGSLITVESWENPYLTARINGSLSGKNLDDLVGNVVIDSTSLYDANFIYNPGPVYLQALSDEISGEKKIELLSSIVEGKLSGNYSFVSIGSELMNALHPHLPTLIRSQQKRCGTGMITST